MHKFLTEEGTSQEEIEEVESIALSEGEEKSVPGFVKGASLEEIKELLKEQNELLKNDLQEKINNLSSLVEEKINNVSSGVDEKILETNESVSASFSQKMDELKDHLDNTLDSKIGELKDNVVSTVEDIKKSITEKSDGDINKIAVQAVKIATRSIVDYIGKNFPK